MARYVIPIVVACVYIAGATWVVRQEGRSYRDSLRPTSPEAAKAPPGPVQPVAEVDLARNDRITPKPPISRPDPPTSASIPAADIPPPPKRTEETAAPPPPPTTPAPPTTASPKPRPATTAPPAAAGLAANIAQWKSDPFWSQPELAKSWNLDHLTIQDENQLGAQLNSLILQLNPEDTGPGLRRVNEAAAPLLKLINPKIRDYRFFVLNSEVANAFSHPGGYVYVSRELLRIIPEGEEALLEFVLAHEIAHVELHHALLCLNAADVRKFRDGTLQKLYFLIIPHGYFKEFEYAADVWAYHKLRQLRRSEHDCLKFLRILDSYAKAHQFENGKGKPEELLKEQRRDPKAQRAFSPIDNHLRSHPAAYDRLNRLKELSSAPRQ
jgi:Zn-dependent protease with chaperone function